MRPSRILAALAIALAGCTAQAEPGADLTPQIRYIVDGDTWHLTSGQRARATDYDAPELFHPRCPAERALAERAKARVAALPVHLTDTGRHDRYGRIRESRANRMPSPSGASQNRSSILRVSKARLKKVQRLI